ncbi:hypothetical protein [Sphaerisporangium sp. TRM90804]|uniref:hypothetical protein n=1 Tax=Sphaerisporangium sp. TRM90804 TaxID=3031113 RepID=UPI0024475F74|nr:hypothetical protein [Sphaerisporangium sp. TRM90804]MDH2430713.1 hypothetical protein [Sphaerisporangium sp. TRM90804]
MNEPASGRTPARPSPPAPAPSPQRPSPTSTANRPPAPATEGSPASAPGWIRWALRLTATGHLLAVLGQATLAGMFVTGEVDLLGVHRDNANTTFALLTLQLAAAVLLWRRGRGPSRPVWAGVGLMVMETGQIFLGQSRVVAAHIPLGVAIFGVSAVITAWTWRALRAEAK